MMISCIAFKGIFIIIQNINVPTSSKSPRGGHALCGLCECLTFIEISYNFVKISCRRSDVEQNRVEKIMSNRLTRRRKHRI